MIVVDLNAKKAAVAAILQRMIEDLATSILADNWQEGRKDRLRQLKSRWRSWASTSVAEVKEGEWRKLGWGRERMGGSGS